MATATATKGTTSKASKAAAAEPTTAAFGAKQLAEHLGTTGHTLRAFIRSLGDAALTVGRGGRYQWSGLSDPAVKRIVKAWTEAAAAE